eukprot:scaffold14903_cov107-Isochrysis_galbana.AAC.9
MRTQLAPQTACVGAGSSPDRLLREELFLRVYLQTLLGSKGWFSSLTVQTTRLPRLSVIDTPRPCPNKRLPTSAGAQRPIHRSRRRSKLFAGAEKVRFLSPACRWARVLLSRPLFLLLGASGVDLVPRDRT